MARCRRRQPSTARQHGCAEEGRSRHRSAQCGACRGQVPEATARTGRNHSLLARGAAAATWLPLRSTSEADSLAVLASLLACLAARLQPGSCPASGGIVENSSLLRKPRILTAHVSTRAAPTYLCDQHTQLPTGTVAGAASTRLHREALPRGLHHTRRCTAARLPAHIPAHTPYGRQVQAATALQHRKVARQPILPCLFCQLHIYSNAPCQGARWGLARRACGAPRRKRRSTGWHPAPYGGSQGRSRRISCAAFRPQIPITPPPGWLAAPHRYSPGMGVRWSAQPGTGRSENNCVRVMAP